MKTNMKKRILIIDDDEDLSMLISDLAEDNGYSVSYAGNLKDAYKLLEDIKPHLILLDINLPDGTGFELCRELRRKSNVPVIFASARNDEEDKINGLDMGGDDYLAKPYSIKELMSRINSLMRRTYGEYKSEEKLILKVNDELKIEIDKNARQILKNGNKIELAPREYDLFIYLYEHRGMVIEKEKLINEIWGPYSEVEQSTLTVHIRWLREKFEINSSKPELIKTVWGIGYIMQ